MWHRRAGASLQRQRRHLNAACAVLRRKPHDELEAVGVAPGQREDEFEGDARRPDDLEIRRRAGKGALMTADRVVLVRRPVDRDRNEVHQRRDVFQMAGVANMPLDVTVVIIPSALARASTCGSGL